MVLSITHSFSAFARRQKGAQWSSFAATNGSRGLCWDTERKYSENVVIIPCLPQVLTPKKCQGKKKKKKISLTAVPL